MDLQNKSPEFLELYAKANPLPNARAKVPLLQVVGKENTTFLCESMVVTEYIAERFDDDERLLPSNSEDRAKMRLFIELCGSTFSYFNILRSVHSPPEEFEKNLETLRDGLRNADAFLKNAHPDGPFVLGDRFSLAECTVAPFVQRSCAVLPAFTGPNNNDNNNDDGGGHVVPQVDPVRLCDELGLDRIKRWIESVLVRPSVVSTGVPTEKMIQTTTSMLERFAAAKK